MSNPCRVYPLMGQRDARWRHVSLGNSKTSTIGEYGCLLTCLAMLVNEFPDALNQQLVAANAFFPAGSACPACLKRPFDVRRWTGRGPHYVRESERYPTKPFPSTEITALREHLLRGNPAIVEVDYNGTAPGGQHFVLAVDAHRQPVRIGIHDPFYNDDPDLVPRYGITHAVAIVGVIYYSWEGIT